MSEDRVAPPISPKAWQRIIRERHQDEDDRPALTSTQGCWVEAITREEAEPFILRYEWLGTLGRCLATYGMRAPDGELIGVSVFGWAGSIQSRDICGADNRQLAVCLERGACSHRAPSNGASFLISRSVKLAAQDRGWRIFYAYADPEAGEIGTVYQACNWLYIGQGIGRGSKKGKFLLRQDWMIPEEGNKVISVGPCASAAFSSGRPGRWAGFRSTGIRSTSTSTLRAPGLNAVNFLPSCGIRPSPTRNALIDTPGGRRYVCAGRR